jgi:hypothetical protein
VTRISTHDPVHDRSDRLTGKSAFRLHLTLALGLALCVGAFAFELSRALGGHTFSWMYVFEWPLFAGFAIYMWWNLYNGYDRRGPSQSKQSSAQGAETKGDIEGLDEWNLYLQIMDAAETESGEVEG